MSGHATNPAGGAAASGRATNPAGGAAASGRAAPPAGLPIDPAVSEGRVPDREWEEVPELHEVDCPPELRERIEELMSRYPERHSASIPALWAVQRRYGWCTPEGIRQAAAVMRVTPAYLESVASFYDLLRTEPVGRHQVLVCTNISCWMRGGDELLAAFRAVVDDEDAASEGAPAERRPGTPPKEPEEEQRETPPNDIFVSGFECLGACDLAPMASIDERYFGPLDPADARTAVEQLRADAEVLPDKALARRALAGGAEGEPDERVRGKKGPNA